jgi:CBS-domain-containing membrane protein
MADPKGAKVATPTDGTGVDARNAINVAMEDLAEEDLRAIEQELEEEMVERRRKKLACFQKMCHNVVKKADIVAASDTKVNSSSLSPKDPI